MTVVRFFATGVVVDDLLTAGNASPVSDDMPPSLVPLGKRGFMDRVWPSSASGRA
ncbi:MAG: hypothetical protein QOC69_1239 [Mycobacterium sp.]|jgi:hypothetical protein|nr:hypothetical protein [Mycobacterium sp.]